MKSFFLEIKNSIGQFKKIIDKHLANLIRFTIYLGVFLIPLFVIPFSNRYIEFSKVLAFYILVILAIILWLIRIYFIKKINFNVNFLDGVILVFTAVYFFSSLFSVDVYQSFIGDQLMVGSSFFTILFFTIFYFFVSRYLDQVIHFKISIYLIMSSIFLLLVNQVLVYFDIGFNILNLSISINSFNFLIFLGFLLNFLLILLSQSKKLKIFHIIFSIIFLAIIFLLDSQLILLVLASAIFIFIVLLSFKSQYFSNKLVIGLTIILFLSVIVLVLPISNYTGLVTPTEFNLSSQYGWQITKASLSENIFLGVGPQNFTYSFFKFKPVEFNQTSFWQFGFTTSSSFWLEFVNNVGLLGGLIILILISSYFYRLIVFIRKFNIEDDYYYKIYLIVSLNSVILFSYIIYGFLTNFDFVLIYLMIFFLSISVSFLCLNEKKTVITNKYIINLSTYLIILVVIVFMVFAAKVTIAESINDKIKSSEFTSRADFIQAQQNLALAKKLNSLNIDYELSEFKLLSEELIYSVENEPELEKIELIEDVSDKLKDLLEIKTNRWFFYNNFYMQVEKIKPLGLSVDTILEDINNEIIDLDPNNPELYINMALFNFTKLSAQKGEATLKEIQDSIYANKVKSNLEQSINLKNDYILGYYNLGLYWQEMGDNLKAIENMEKALQIKPNQKIIILDLKKLYLNQDKVEEAKNILSKYLQVNPNDEEIQTMLEKL